MIPASVEDLRHAELGDTFILDGYVEGHTFSTDSATVHTTCHPWSTEEDCVILQTGEMGEWVVRLAGEFIDGVYIPNTKKKEKGLTAFLNKHTKETTDASNT